MAIKFHTSCMCKVKFIQVKQLRIIPETAYHFM